MLICCSVIISDYYQCCKHLCFLIFLRKQFLSRFSFEYLEIVLRVRALEFIRNRMGHQFTVMHLSTGGAQLRLVFLTFAAGSDVSVMLNIRCNLFWVNIKGNLWSLFYCSINILK